VWLWLFDWSMGTFWALLLFCVAVAIFLDCFDKKGFLGFRKVIRDGRKIITAPSWIKLILLISMLATIITGIAAG